MANPNMKVSMSEVAKGITINVTATGYRIFHIRLTIAMALIRLAAFVAGMGFKANV